MNIIQKIDILCPVLSIDIIHLPTTDVILFSEGPYLHAYNLLSGVKLVSTLIFESNIIHGITRCSKSLSYIIFGEKSVCRINIDFDPVNIEKIIHLDSLDDLVLNCHVVDEIDVLIIGYSHNFVDMYCLKSNIMLRRIQHFKCVLFSMSFSPQPGHIASGTAFGKIFLWELDIHDNHSLTDLQTSTMDGHEGVVFRMRWRCDGHQLVSVSDDRTVRLWDTTTKKSLLKCWGHECRIWDAIFLHECTSNQLLASCGEDSSIRIWDMSGSCIYTLIGHNGRNIWRLTSTSSDKILISAGNDSTVKIWELDTLQHLCPQATDSTPFILEIPYWNHLSSSHMNHNENKRKNGVSILRISPDGALLVVVLLDGAVWLVVTNPNTDSTAALLPMTTATDGVKPDYPSTTKSMRWIPGTHLQSAVTTADISFMANTIDCIFAHPDCTVTFLQLNLTTLLSSTTITTTTTTSTSTTTTPPPPLPLAPLTTTTTTTIPTTADTLPITELRQATTTTIVTTHIWSPHNMRTINLWILPEVAKSTQSRLDHHISQLLIMTATVKGQCALWNISLEIPCSSPQLITRFVCLKSQIASACLWFELPPPTSSSSSPSLIPPQQSIPTRHQINNQFTVNNSCIIVGDSKGGLSLFPYVCTPLVPSSSSHQDIDSSSKIKDSNYFNSICSTQADLGSRSPTDSFISATWTYNCAHSIEPVSCIRQISEYGFASLGYDSHICIFYVLSSVDVRLSRKLSTLPITTPEIIMMQYSSASSASTSTMLVGGYQGNLFQVWDISNKQQLMSVEGGSWKRNHAARIINTTSSSSSSSNSTDSTVSELTFPTIVFASACPTSVSGVSTTEIKLHHTGRIESTGTTSRSSYKLPRQIGRAGHGKVTYTVALLNTVESTCPQTFAVSGGEGGVLKLFSLPTLSLVCDLPMPHHVPIRSVSVSCHEGSNSGIIVAVGGRLSYAIWRYTFDTNGYSNSDTTNNNYINSRCTNSNKLQQNNIRVYVIDEGSIWKRATQDHRILCSSLLARPMSLSSRGVTAVPPTDTSYISDIYCKNILEYDFLFGDSRGHCSIGKIEEKEHDQLVVKEEFIASEYPILCGKLIALCSTPIVKEERNSVRGVTSTTKVDGEILPVEILEKGEGDNIRGNSEEYESSIHYYMVGILGTTAGDVSIWLLSGSFYVENSHSSNKVSLGKSLRLASYEAHLMGCNALSVLLLPSDPDEDFTTTTTGTTGSTSSTATTDITNNITASVSSMKLNSSNISPLSVTTPTTDILNGNTTHSSRTSTVCNSNNSTGTSYDVLICSGGDDQSITLKKVRLYVTHHETSFDVSVNTLSSRRFHSCSGSAIKGISLKQCNNTTTIVIPPSTLGEDDDDNDENDNNLLTVALTNSTTSPLYSDNITIVTNSTSITGGKSQSLCSSSRSNNAKFTVFSVGYDQRLSVWNFTENNESSNDNINPKIHTTLENKDSIIISNESVLCASTKSMTDNTVDTYENTTSNPKNKDETVGNLNLEWITGRICNIGDVSGMDVVVTPATLPVSTSNNNSDEVLFNNEGVKSQQCKHGYNVIVVGEGTQLFFSPIHIQIDR